MARNIYGGGSLTNVNGLRFEQETSLIDSIRATGRYSIDGVQVINNINGEVVAEILSKRNIYKKLLEPNGIDYRRIISKLLIPDDAIRVFNLNTIYIIEKKFQSVAGSVDEKLQTCGFKLRQYRRLITDTLDMNVEYIYVLNDWFVQPQYGDVLDYILECDCSYYFNEIPLDRLGL